LALEKLLSKIPNNVQALRLALSVDQKQLDQRYPMNDVKLFQILAQRMPGLQALAITGFGMDASEGKAIANLFPGLQIIVSQNGAEQGIQSWKWLSGKGVTMIRESQRMKQIWQTISDKYF
jgi:hypothetical protein